MRFGSSLKENLIRTATFRNYSLSLKDLQKKITCLFSGLLHSNFCSCKCYKRKLEIYFKQYEIIKSNYVYKQGNIT